MILDFELLSWLLFRPVVVLLLSNNWNGDVSRVASARVPHRISSACSSGSACFITEPELCLVRAGSPHASHRARVTDSLQHIEILKNKFSNSVSYILIIGTFGNQIIRACTFLKI